MSHDVARVLDATWASVVQDVCRVEATVASVFQLVARVLVTVDSVFHDVALVEGVTAVSVAAAGGGIGTVCRRKCRSHVRPGWIAICGPVTGAGAIPTVYAETVEAPVVVIVPPP